MCGGSRVSLFNVITSRIGESGGWSCGRSVATASHLNHEYINEETPLLPLDLNHTLGRRSICPLLPPMTPRLKAIPPFMGITGSLISSSNGTSGFIGKTPADPERCDDCTRSRTLPECDLQEVRSLKAFIAYDAIVHPDHPLSVEKGGAELYLGTTAPPSKSRFF